jgi:hypothetical protein
MRGHGPVLCFGLSYNDFVDTWWKTIESSESAMIFREFHAINPSLNSCETRLRGTYAMRSIFRGELV